MGVSYIVSVAKDTSGAGNDRGKRLLSGFRGGFSRSNGWQDGTDAGTGTEEAQCVINKRAKSSESWNRIRLGQQWDGLGRLSQCYLGNNFGNSLFFWGQLLLSFCPLAEMLAFYEHLGEKIPQSLNPLSTTKTSSSFINVFISSVWLINGWTPRHHYFASAR